MGCPDNQVPFFGAQSAMMFTLYLVLLACLGAPAAHGVSKAVLDHASYINGDWDNKAQFELGQVHDFIQFRCTPVLVPALGSAPAVLIEEAVNGVIVIFQLAVATDGPGNSVIVKLYNFTDVSKIKPRTYNPEKISEVKPEDLQTDDDCFASFVFAPSGVQAGTYPYCGYTFNGKHPRVGLTFTCNTATVVVPRGTRQEDTAIPYLLEFKGPRYPLINPSEGYVSPCN